MSVRVLIVDDHAAVREGLRRSLETYGLNIVGEAGDGAAALQATAELRPDVVLMDVALPDSDGVEVTRRLVAANPGTQVVMLTMFGDRPTVSAAIEAGATGYLVKDCTTAEIASVINSVATGDTALSSGIAETMLRVARTSADPLISARELEVLQLVAEGASTADVAAKLYISAKTVKNHLANIYQKLEANDRTQAVLQGLRMGIIRLR
jgi:two-component system, NarL family, response regulator DegU